MKRGKKLCLVCHCILNGNSKVGGSCKYEGANVEVVKSLMDRGYGIIQLPCPENTIYGIRRWGHVKEQFDNNFYRKVSRDLLNPIIDEIQDYINNGYTLEHIVGVFGSPSCGVYHTCSSALWHGELSKNENLSDTLKTVNCVDGSGVFIEELINIIEERNIDTKFVEVRESNILPQW